MAYLNNCCAKPDCNDSTSIFNCCTLLASSFDYGERQMSAFWSMLVAREQKVPIIKS